MDDQNSRQQRRGLVDRANSAFTTGRRIYKLTSKARTAGILAANPEVWAVVGSVVLIVLIVFGMTLSTGEAADIPTDTNGGQNSQTSTPISHIGGKCSMGTNLCSPQNLSVFGSNATTASTICNTESGGQSDVINKSCLTGVSVDYSVGLFQFNMMAQCPQAFSCLDTTTRDGPNCPGSTYCTIGNQAILNDCVARFSNTTSNIQAAVQLSKSGTDWSHWGAAYACGIL